MKMNQQVENFSQKQIKEVFKISVLVILLSFASSIELVSSEDILISEATTVTLALLGMLFIPMLFGVKIQKKKLSSLGWKWPVNTKKVVLYSLLVFLVMLPAVFVFGSTSSFQNFYISRGLSSENFTLLVLIIPLFYFFAEEFLFRGFFFFSVFRKIGIHAFWITSLVFAFLHLTKPVPEVIFSFFAGILFCFLSYKTKSFLPAFAVHFLISALINGFIVFG